MIGLKTIKIQLNYISNESESVDVFITFKTIICLAVMATLFTGCATKTLMTKDNKTYTRTNKVTLIEDQVVAFGKPAQPLPNLPVHSLVIAGQQKSYVLTQGGPQFVSLIGKLDPKNIQVTRELSFFSEKMMVILQGHYLCPM